MLNRIGQIFGLWIVLALLVLAIGGGALLVQKFVALGLVPCLLIGIPAALFGCYGAIRLIAR